MVAPQRTWEGIRRVAPYGVAHEIQMKIPQDDGCYVPFEEVDLS